MEEPTEVGSKVVAGLEYGGTARTTWAKIPGGRWRCLDCNMTVLWRGLVNPEAI